MTPPLTEIPLGQGYAATEADTTSAQFVFLLFFPDQKAAQDCREVNRAAHLDSFYAILMGKGGMGTSKFRRGEGI